MGTDPAAEAVQRFLEALGQDPTRAGLVGTPARVAELYHDLLAGTDVDPADVLEVTSTEENDELILLRDVAFYSLCEHHLLPWMGKAHVGYIPNKKGEIAGLSNLARVVDICAKRLQMQERLTTQVADAVERALDPRGVIVVVEAEHLCMSMRGVHAAGHATVTSAVRGVFRENVATRAEAMAIIRGR